jgi:hypothetical protein
MQPEICKEQGGHERVNCIFNFHHYIMHGKIGTFILIAIVLAACKKQLRKISSVVAGVALVLYGSHLLMATHM